MPSQLTRRNLLELGGLGVVGLSLPDVLRAEARSTSRPLARARSCILFFMEGGPAHQDLWDMKPDAPSEYRGEFRSIPTRTPGVEICEHLPLLAREFHHFAQIRSVHHKVNDHNAGAYYCLTGRSPLDGTSLIRQPSRKLFPTYGAVLSKLHPTGNAIPDFVQIPELLSNLGVDLPGQFGGFLGGEHSPYVTGDPSLEGFQPPGLSLRPEVPPPRLDRRRRLFRQMMDHTLATLGEQTPFLELDEHHRRAFELLTSSPARAAFDLSAESDAARERYGFDHDADRSKLAREFGRLPHLGQSLLLARRLIEAGTRLVTVATGRRFCQAWDTHRKHFPLLKESLLPMTDRALSALMADLEERDLLKDTLVVAMGEFGRTPRIGQITSNAGADARGRDHWPDCYTVLLAGDGITEGAVYGASDRHAAYPQRDPVTPEDIAATIYWALGLDPTDEIDDHLGRPLPLATGRPLTSLFS